MALEAALPLSAQLLTAIWLAANSIAVAVQAIGKAALRTIDRRDTRGTDFIATRIRVARGQRLEDNLTFLSIIPGVRPECHAEA